MNHSYAKAYCGNIESDLMFNVATGISSNHDASNTQLLPATVASTYLHFYS